MTKTKRPTSERGLIESELLKKGQRFAGVDEVGRGCIAGSVFAACVEIDFELLMKLPSSERDLIRDSKTLSAAKRARILERIHEISIRQYIGVATIHEIERLNILQASFLAMARAIDGAKLTADTLVLVDGNSKISGFHGQQRTITKGDQLCYCIAAASILAKEARDMYMCRQAELYPNYGFEKHVGYATSMHIEKLTKHGPCEIHRTSFEPVKSIVAANTKTHSCII